MDAGNLVEMTDRMAADLANDPRVREVVAREGALRVVVEPVENRMTGEVLPRGQAEMFTARIRALLSRHDPEHFVWVMNRATLDQLRQQELRIPLGPNREEIQPRYALWGHFHTLTQEDSQRRSSHYLCVFELTDLERRTTLWSDSYQLSKAVTRGFLD